MSDLEERLLQQMRDALLPEPTREYPFASQDLSRRWRFDFAWPRLGFAVEVDGATRSMGRHNRGSGFEKDLEKLNTAILLGWTVVRVTGSMVDDGSALRDIELGMMAARFWPRVERASEPDACWLYRGPVNLAGYGVVVQGRKQVLAHRLVFQLADIALDPALTIDHLCKNKLCVRLSHLEEVTRSENARRATARDVCKKAGHPLKRTRQGRSWCPECQRERRLADPQATEDSTDSPSSYLAALVAAGSDVVEKAVPTSSGRMAVPSGAIHRLSRLLEVEELKAA